MELNNSIFEGNGISDSLKNYPDFIYKNYLINNKGFKTNIIMDNLKVVNLSFVFTNEESMIDTKLSKYNGDVLDYVIINIKIGSEKDMKNSIIHEITHLLKFYNERLDIKKDETGKEILSKLNKLKSSLITSMNVNKSFINKLNDFTTFMYYSFDDELNSRISELYIELKNSNIRKGDEIKKYIEKSDVYDKLKIIENFNPEEFIKKFSYNEHIELFDFFNDFITCLKSCNINFKLNKISNIDELIIFLKRIKKYIEPKIYKHYRKIKGIELEFKRDFKFESIDTELKYLKLFYNFKID